MKRVLRKTGIRFLAVTLIGLTFFNCGYGQALDSASLNQFFDRLSQKNKAMGSLIIARDGNILYNRSIGFSLINGSEKKPMSAATRHRVGSVTKMFTAVMIYQLIDEGTLKLADHLDKFFPQVPNASTITMANILAHRSGIHDVTGDQDFRALRFKQVAKEEIISFMAKSTPDFAPDAKYAYSNSGYFILGAILEKITGKTYDQALKERICDRIGLKDTYLGTGNIDASKNESYSYRYLLEWEQQPETHMSILFGSGALISTAADMARFIQTLFNKKLVSRESFEKMIQYNSGMDTFTYNGKTFYGHTGGIDNFGAWLMYQPEEKLTVAYATNAKVYPVSKIIDGIVDILYNKPFTIPAFEPIVLSPELLDKYVGVYSLSAAPVKFTVSRDSTTLFVQLSGQSRIPVSPLGEDKFEIENAGIVFEFDIPKKQMTQKRDGRARVFTKED